MSWPRASRPADPLRQPGRRARGAEASRLSAPRLADDRQATQPQRLGPDAGDTPWPSASRLHTPGPPELRPDERGIRSSFALRLLGQILVLGVMAGSSIVGAQALRSENAATSPAAVAPIAEAPIEAPPAEEPQPEDLEPKEPEDPGPPLPTPREHLDDKSGFVHPGVLVTLPQLTFVRDQIRAGKRPWIRAYDQMRNSPYADLHWQPRPREVVECGYYSNPDIGCRDEWRDAVAAYTHALMWYFTGIEDHALKSIEIIDAWSATLRSHTGGNAPLQAAWSGATLVRAAELMRYTYPDWDGSKTRRAMEMFRYVYLPEIRNGAPARSEGNWDLIMTDALIGISIFIDIRDLFDKAVAMWRARVPAYIYHSSDGATPVRPPRGVTSLTTYWHGQTTYVDGLVQETCRDLGHTAWGLEALAHVAETAWIQGVDLWAEAQPRLISALEFHAGFAVGDGVPGWLCGGSLQDSFSPIPEIAYNHYHNRLGIEMPRSQELISRERPQRASHFYAWTSLTTGYAPDD